MSQTFTFPQAATELAKALKTKVQEHQTQIEELRAKELRKSSGGKLTKHELCALCSNALSKCKCTGLKKSEGCKECGGVGAHPKTCSLALKNPKVMGKSEMCKSGCGKSHMGKCDLSEVKVVKDEIPMVHAAPEKTRKGVKLPGQKKSKVVPAPGSGGEIIKKSAFSDALHTAAGAKPPVGPAKGVVGVGGKQPVGMGGGDAHKVPQAVPATPLPQVNRELAGAKSIAGGGLPTAGAIGKLPHSPGLMPRAGNVQKPIAGSFVTRKDEVSPAGAPPAGAAQPIRDQANLAADKKAGGVGWLNALHAHVNRPKATKVSHDVMTVRDQMNVANPPPAAAAPAGAGPVRASGKPSTYAGTKGMAALARGEKKAEKTEVPAPTGGLSSINHNRRLMKITR